MGYTRTTVFIDGKMYNSIADACNDKELNKHNISYATVLNRLKSGEWYTKDLFRKAGKKRKSNNHPIINGKEYFSLQDACKDNSLNIHKLAYATIQNRLKRGMTLEKAFSLKKGGKLAKNK